MLIGLSTNNVVQGEEEEQGRVEFKFPLLIFRTRKFTRLYDRLGAWNISRLFSWVALIGMPIVGAFGLYLIFNTLLTLLTVPAAREIGRELGPQAHILLPGVNPYLPILYGWISIVAAIAVHEGAHGVIARSLGFRVKSSGLLFFLAIPVGAFVDVDEEEIKKAEAKDSVRVLAAGSAANISVAVVSIAVVLVITSGLSPAVDGLFIFEVTEGMPAEEAGLLSGDVLIEVEGEQTKNITDFKNVMEDKSPGDVVRVTVARGESWGDRFSTSIKLVEHEGRAVLGVALGEILIEQRLRTYQKLSTETPFIHFMPPTLAQGLIPFSEALISFYTHPLGEYWHVIANIFFWLWFINVNIAVFNTLPIHPLDGGQAFKNVLKSLLKTNKKLVSQISNAVTAIVILIIASMIVLPFVI